MPLCDSRRALDAARISLDFDFDFFDLEGELESLLSSKGKTCLWSSKRCDSGGSASYISANLFRCLHQIIIGIVLSIIELTGYLCLNSWMAFWCNS